MLVVSGCFCFHEDLKLEYKRVRFQEEKEYCLEFFKFSKSRCCDGSGNKERNLGLEVCE